MVRVFVWSPASAQTPRHSSSPLPWRAPPHPASPGHAGSPRSPNPPSVCPAAGVGVMVAMSDISGPCGCWIVIRGQVVSLNLSWGPSMPLARSGPPVRNTAHPGLVRARGVLRSINAAPIPKYRPPLHATASLLPQAHCGVSEFPRPYQPIAELESRLQFLSDPQPIGYTAPEEKHGMARRARRRRIKRIGLLCS